MDGRVRRRLHPITDWPDLCVLVCCVCLFLFVYRCVVVDGLNCCKTFFQYS